MPLVSRFVWAYVCISNGRHYKTHILSPHRVQNNRNVFFSPFSLLRQQRLSQLNLNATLLAPGLFDYPQTGSCAGFHSFHHALTSVSRLPCRTLWEVIFSASPLCRWFWLPLPSLVVKRWILVLTRELTLLPSLSPGCLPDGLSRLDILGHMLIWVAPSGREDAATGVCRMRRSDRNITARWKPYWPFALPQGGTLHAATKPYILF